MSSRTTNPTIAHTASTSSMTIRSESNQSSFSPRSNMSWSSPNPTTISTRPIASIRVGRLTNVESKRNTLTMMKPSTPMGRLM
jgi:hypothetical protein